jgi:ligand-binding sensor domain-containing protein
MHKIISNLPVLISIVFSTLFLLAFSIKIDSNNEIIELSQPLLENTIIKKEVPSPVKNRPYGNWVNFTIRDGLPSNKVFCVRVDEERVWAGTDNGLALLEDGKWKTFNTADGLAHNGVLALDISPVTGDLWIATLGGLSRYSAGKFDTYTQFNSGLANDVIYQVICDGKDVWVATAGGASRLDTYSGKWSIFTEKNAPMHEPWTYGITAGGGKIYIAAWGGGVIEYDTETEHFRDYIDPDGEMELDLFPDDGLVHDITTGVTYANDILWVGTYFGLSRYDGNHWKGYFDHDSGLASNFINNVKAKGDVVWLCTDKGVTSFDGEYWITYQKLDNLPGGLVTTRKGTVINTVETSTSIAHNFVLGVDFQDDRVWLATSEGLSVGTPISDNWLPVKNN